MFNVGGPEFLVILLVALVVLGPQRLPDALRQVGKFVGEARRISTSFQNEVQEAMKDPVKKVTGKELPKDAREVVGFAVNEPFKAQEPREPESAPAPDTAASSNDGEPAKSAGPRFASAEPAKPVQQGDSSVEPAHISADTDADEVFGHTDSAAGPDSGSEGDSESGTPDDDVEVPMFGDR